MHVSDWARWQIYESEKCLVRKYVKGQTFYKGLHDAVFLTIFRRKVMHIPSFLMVGFHVVSDCIWSN